MEKQPTKEQVLIERAAYWHEIGEFAAEQRRACLEELGMVQIAKDAVKLVLIQGGKQ